MIFLQQEFILRFKIPGGIFKGIYPEIFPRISQGDLIKISTVISAGVPPEISMRIPSEIAKQITPEILPGIPSGNLRGISPGMQVNSSRNSK